MMSKAESRTHINEIRIMIKIYKYNQLRNTVKIDICSKGGVRGTLVFDQGNVFTKEFPTVQVRTEFWQQAIEDSKLFKTGTIKLVQVIKEETDEEEKPVQDDTYKVIEEVDSVEKAIDYVASNFGVVCKTRVKVINEAHKHGVDFPNM